MKIKYIEKEEQKGCAIACLAMVLGKTYKKVRKDFINDFSERGIKIEEMLDYLWQENVGIVHKSIIYLNRDSRLRKELLKPFAPVHIVSTVPFADSTGHSVVMTNTGKILCPDGCTQKLILESYLFTDVIGCYPNRKTS